MLTEQMERNLEVTEIWFGVFQRLSVTLSPDIWLYTNFYMKKFAQNPYNTEYNMKKNKKNS